MKNTYVSTNCTDILYTSITFVPNIRKPQEFEEIPLKTALRHTKRGKYRDLIEAARLDIQNGDLDAYKLKKNALPAYAFSGTFDGKVINADFDQSSGLVPIDIDKLSDEKERRRIRETLSKDPHIAFVCDSPSGEGLKAAVRVDQNLIFDDKSYKIAFDQLSKSFAVKGIIVDESCKDVRRLCFVSYDPELYYNRDPDVFPIHKHKVGKTVSELLTEEEDGDTAPGVLPDITLENAASYLPPPGDQGYDEWLKVGMALHHQFKGNKKALAIFDNWSQEVQEYKGFEDVAETWAQLGKRTSGAPLVTFRSLIKAHNKLSQTITGELCLRPEWQDNLIKLVDMLNQTHAQVMVGGRHHIMRAVPTGAGINNRVSCEFIRLSELKLVYANTSIKVDEKSFKGAKKDVFDNHIMAWANHPNSQTYKGGVIFKPNGKVPDGYLNTWQGFAVEPKKNHILCVLIMQHIEQIICAGDQKLINYFYNWVAYTLQHPNRPAGSALVLRGEKGSGKGIIGHFLFFLWGNHALHISNPKHLVGNFNAHLADVCFLFSDEAFFSGDKQHEGVLKALITEPTFMVERKGIDATAQKNYLKVFMVTNNKFAVPASKDERRYGVFDVSSEKIGDGSYFDALRRACKDPEVQSAFLYEMLNRDIKGFHTGKIPESVGLREQRYHSLPSAGKWLADSLSNGSFTGGDSDDDVLDGWKSEALSSELHASYLSWCDKLRVGEYDRDSQIILSKYLGDIYKKKQLGSKRLNGFVLGTLKEATVQFQKFEGIKLSVLK